MRPAKRAVARVDPQLAHACLANIGDIGGRGRAQASPEMRLAAVFSQARVAHAR